MDVVHALRLLGIVAVAALGCVPSRPAGVADIPLPVNAGPNVRDVSSELSEVRKKYRVPALAAAAFDSHRLLGIGVVGERKMGSGVRATIEDRWHLGSNTKAMTAALVSRLVQRGTVQGTSTLSELFVGEEMHGGWRGVTIDQLLSHRGGAPSSFEDAEDVWRYMAKHRGVAESRSVRDGAVRKLLAARPYEDVGDLAYSNAGYMIVGAALERRTNTSWEDLMRRELFEPLGMTGCGFGPPGECLDGKLCTTMSQPLGHKEVGTSYYVPMPPGPLADNPPSMGPAGTVHCDLRSWGRFLQDELRSARGEGGSNSRLLPVVRKGPSGSKDFVLGWGITERRWAKGTVLFEQGSNTLNYSNVWLSPKLDRVFVAVTNGGSSDDFLATDDAIGVLLEKFGS